MGRMVTSYARKARCPDPQGPRRPSQPRLLSTRPDPAPRRAHLGPAEGEIELGSVEGGVAGLPLPRLGLDASQESISFSRHAMRRSLRAMGCGNSPILHLRR